MENFKIARSEAKDTSEAVKSIKEQLSGIDACLVLYFVSTLYPVETVSKEMADAFPGVQTVGCTTAGEMITGSIGLNSIVAMAWHNSTLKHLQIELLENIKEDCAKAVAKAFKSFEKTLGISMHELDPERYVGMLLVDGLSKCEERLNDSLGNLTNVPFIGGSAGDDLKFQSTWVFVNGKAYNNAAVFLLMKPTNGYITLKTQSFNITGKKLIPTKVDELERIIYEFDGAPASEAYATALGITPDELLNTMGEYPLGLVFDEDNFFVRSPQQFIGTAVTFACMTKEGSELRVLEPTDIVATTRDVLKKLGQMQAIVDFNCAYRFTELQRKNQLNDYAAIFDVPTIGFSTYGESYIGHINQTSTMLIIK